MPLPGSSVTRAWMLLCVVLMWLGVQQGTARARSVTPRACQPIPVQPIADNGGMASPAAYPAAFLLTLLADETMDAYCLGREFPTYLGVDVSAVLAGVLISRDQPPRLRERAALALGGVRTNVESGIDALANDLASERDENVFLARLDSLGSLLFSQPQAKAEGVDSIAALMANLEQASRSPIASAIDYRDNELASRRMARVLVAVSRLLTETPRTAPLRNRLLSMAAYVVLPKETRAPIEDTWRAPFLNSLQFPIMSEQTKVDSATRKTILHSLAQLTVSTNADVQQAACELARLVAARPEATADRQAVARLSCGH